MSVERPMNILQRSNALIHLLVEEGALTPAEIADRIDTPRPTVYRLSEALAHAGLTESRPGSRIALSRRWLRLGDAARTAMTEWQMATPVLAGLAEVTGQTVFLCVPNGDRAVCVDWSPGQAIGIVLQLRPGRSLPLFAGAEGRAMLAFGVEDVADYLEGSPFPAYTDRTKVSAAHLRRDVTQTRKRGYSISDEDVTEGIGAIGAPLYTSRVGRFAGTLSVAGLADTMTEHRRAFAASLMDAAAALSATLP